MIEYCWLVPLLPLLGAAVAAVGGRWLKGQSHVPVIAGIGLAFLVSVLLLRDAGPSAVHHEAAKGAVMSGTGVGGARPGSMTPERPSDGRTVLLYRWIDAGELHVPVVFRVDGLTTKMLARSERTGTIMFYIGLVTTAMALPVALPGLGEKPQREVRLPEVEPPLFDGGEMSHVDRHVLRQMARQDEARLEQAAPSGTHSCTEARVITQRFDGRC